MLSVVNTFLHFDDMPRPCRPGRGRSASPSWPGRSCRSRHQLPTSLQPTSLLRNPKPVLCSPAACQQPGHVFVHIAVGMCPAKSVLPTRTSRPEHTFAHIASFDYGTRAALRARPQEQEHEISAFDELPCQNEVLRASEAYLVQQALNEATG